MRTRFLSGLVFLASAFVLSVPVAAQTPDASLGTWKLDLAKSKYEPANLAPKSQISVQAAVPGGGMKTTVDVVDSEGKKLHTVVTTKFDGKPSEVVGAADANTTRVYKRIDSRTYEFVTSIGGKVTTTSRSVVSADGKTRTVTATGKNLEGLTVHNVSVYVRQ
jgi:hypothetical protein